MSAPETIRPPHDARFYLTCVGIGLLAGALAVGIERDPSASA